MLGMNDEDIRRLQLNKSHCTGVLIELPAYYVHTGNQLINTHNSKQII